MGTFINVKTLSLLLAVTALTILSLPYSNCSNARFSNTKTDGSGIVTLDLPDPEDIDRVLKSCSEAEQAGRLVTVSQTIVFDDTAVESGRPGDICQFETGDNLSMVNEVIRARYTQDRGLNLPANAVLCSLSLESNLNNFRYDDVFFLNFNGFLLASNNRTAVDRGLTSSSVVLPNSRQQLNAYTYSWLGVRNQPFQNFFREDYCIGQNISQSTCEWPLTEQSGRFVINLSKEILVALSAEQSNQTFQFVITGDNDPNVDCYHARLETTANVQYYIK